MTALAIVAASASTLDRPTDDVVAAGATTEADGQPVGASRPTPEAPAATLVEPRAIPPQRPCDAQVVPTDLDRCPVDRWSEVARLDEHADPDVLVVDNTLHVYATNTLAVGNAVHTTIDDTGTVTSDALPVLPEWTTPGWVWAPDVVALDDGYAMYFTSREAASGEQCIGVAFADDPAGPFVDDTDAPLVCQRELGGSIDASVHEADGQHYLVWKNDGNSRRLASSIWAQPLSSNGRTLLDDPVRVLDATQPWEGRIVEAPEMFEIDGEWVLLYSANRFDTGAYTTGVARCDGPVGPCRSTGEPWLDEDEPLLGLGGMSTTVLADGETRLVAYHGWPDDEIGGRDTRATVVALVPATGDGAPWAGIA